MSKKKNDGKKVAGDANSDANTSEVRPIPDIPGRWPEPLSGADGALLHGTEDVMEYCAKNGVAVLLHDQVVARPDRTWQEVSVIAHGLETRGHGTYLAAAPGRTGYWVGVIDETLQDSRMPYLVGNGGAFEVRDSVLLELFSEAVVHAIDGLDCPCNNDEQYADSCDDAIDFIQQLSALQDEHNATTAPDTQVQPSTKNVKNEGSKKEQQDRRKD